MIFAKLDVCFWSHEKFVEVGPAAAGYWAGVLAYLRDHEKKDGVIPSRVTGMILGVGSEDAARFCAQLVGAGLFKARKHGYELLGYALKNETKEQIEARRQETLRRVHKHRMKPDCNGVTPAVTPLSKNAFVPASDSDSDSVSDLGSVGDGGSGSLTAAPDDIPITDEIRATCSMAGASEPDRSDVALCLANARKKGHVRADWSAELVSWMIRGKRFDRPSGVVPVAPPAVSNEGRVDHHLGKRFKVINGQRVEIPRDETG